MAHIEIINARKHNLKNIHLKIPKEKITTITGVSGSGKSSLAYDTLFMEGQKKYLESLSLYARQFLKNTKKTQVKLIKGISPTISIDQKHTSFYFNATVGTLSEIDYYLRILYSKVGVPFCPACKGKISRYSHKELIAHTVHHFADKIVYIFASIVRNRKGNFRKLLEKYQKKGYQKALIDGKIFYLDSLPELKKNKNHFLLIMIDAIKVKSQNYEQLSESLELANFEGGGEILIRTGDRDLFFSSKYFCQRCKLSLKEPQQATFSPNSSLNSCVLCQGRGIIQGNLCTKCQGSGLNEEALSFYFKGYNIFELGEMDTDHLLEFFKKIESGINNKDILFYIVPPIIKRLEIFSRLNLGYINLNRKINSLAGGEIQRTRLVSQIGFDLSGIIYILDEPSIGLHPSEQESLIKILQKFKEKKNTVVIVEHDEDIIKSSDYIIEMGPDAGENGGRVIFSDQIKRLKENTNSLTSDFIYKRKELNMPKDYPLTFTDGVKIDGLSINNIINIDLEIPLNVFTVVSGVSGSGKSSLIIDGFYPLVKERIEKKKSYHKLPQYKSIFGTEKIKKILLVDQKNIGKNARSCIATYLNLLPAITQLFAELTEAKIRGYQAGRFNYNNIMGQCKACSGLGEKKINLNYLPDLINECEVCEGKRYNSDVLLIKFNGLSIAQVLQLAVTEAYDFFVNIPVISRKLQVVKNMGLGYLILGQMTSTLSGGESQRLKLCKELVKASPEKTVYLFDEPTVGLHYRDIQNLLTIFNSLISGGNTIVVIEHNLDIIRFADYIIDLGPFGGKKGGKVIFKGRVADLVKNDKSLTGKYLRKRLQLCQ